MRYRFQVREHASDKAATAYGKTLNEVFEAAAYAMFDIMMDLATVRPREARAVALEKQYGEDLLRDWLDELLFLFDTEKLVFSEFAVEVECPPAPEKTCRRVEMLQESEGEATSPCEAGLRSPQSREPWRLRGAARGQRYTAAVEQRGAVVKAVTYHRFALRPPEAPDGDWAAEMVFDV